MSTYNYEVEEVVNAFNLIHLLKKEFPLAFFLSFLKCIGIHQQSIQMLLKVLNGSAFQVF